MDIGEELKGKAGPFPLYVWLLILTAVAGVFFLLRKKKAGASPQTGTPGTPCTQTDGSAGTWDSTGTVCQASTVSTTAATATTGMNGSMRNWRSPSTTATATSGTGTTGTTTPVTTGSTTPPPSAPVTTVPPPATNLVTVPNCTGMSAGAAHNAIAAAGLVPTAPAGQKDNMKVSYTNPGFGARVAPGSKVLIETSGYVT